MRFVLKSRLYRVFMLFSGCIALGVTGHTSIAGWQLDDSPYMTVITIGVVGFSEAAR